MGVPPEQAARRPCGELLSCKSGFGVRDMHGGAWEWTEGSWGRGSTRELGVLRGGNAVAGEIAGRCANGLARPANTKSPTMGLRCCAGPKNEAKVDVPQVVGPALERSMKTTEVADPLLPTASAAWSPAAVNDAGVPFAFVHAFTWHPVANEELVVASGCAKDLPRPKCGLLVGRTTGDDRSSAADASAGGGGAPQAKPDILLQVDTGFEAAEVAEVGDAKHMRFKGLDAKSAYLRDFTYVFGRVELGPVQR